VKSYQLPTVTGSPTISRGYNTDGQLVSYGLSNVSKTLERDRLGNVLNMRNAGATTADSVYIYDKLNRLTDLTIASISQNYHYGYDSLGNRLSKSANGSATTYTINPANNRLATVNGVTQSYDAAGNLTSNGSTTWTYNARGRLVSAKLANAVVYNYGINGLGQRVTKTSTAIATGKVIYVYDEAGHLIGEYNNTGTPVWEHIYLGDLPVAVINGAGTVFPVLSDHLGTPRQVINASKQLRWKWDNTEPFGANAANQNPANLGVFAYNLRFPGQYFDAETGLHYNYFRDYNPQTGRYIESDPIGLDGGLNTFGYVLSNPLKYIDINGDMVATPDQIQAGIDILIGEAALLGGDPQGWVKRVPRASPKMYRCRYFISVNPPDVCPSPKCPIFATGEGEGSLKEAYKKAFKEAHDKIPSQCSHQHHGQAWCREGNQKPFWYK
jgi:RHS repeat-associated protein